MVPVTTGMHDFWKIAVGNGCTLVTLPPGRGKLRTLVTFAIVAGLRCQAREGRVHIADWLMTTVLWG